MTDPFDSVVLARFPDELSALLLVGDLEAEGIPAQVLGGLTAQFRVEAPALVSVLVRRGDLVRAERLLVDRALPDDWEESDEADDDDADELGSAEDRSDDAEPTDNASFDDRR